VKLNIPKLIVLLDLGEYNPEMKGQILYVWVDPPRIKFQEYDQFVLDAEKEEASLIEADLAPVADAEKDKPGLFDLIKTHLAKLVRVKEAGMQRRAQGTERRILAWYAELWSQNPDSAWTLDELIALEDTNPALRDWLFVETWRLINENRDRKKKSIASQVKQMAQS
jgi:hypothetical protein